jgi:surface antigen
MHRASRHLVLAILVALALPAAAQPPPHAPAHGWRKKNDPTYPGYAGRTWVQDFGVLAGRCNTAAVLGATGAAVGGAIGARSGDPVIGIIVGSAIGAVIGTTVGRELDGADQACIGHALELVPVGRTVAWTSATQVAYTLTPVRDLGSGCREFRLEGQRGGKGAKSTQVACSGGDGRWQVR